MYLSNTNHEISLNVEFRHGTALKLVAPCLAAVLAIFAASTIVHAQNIYQPYAMNKYRLVLSANRLSSADDTAALQSGQYVYDLVGQEFTSDKRPRGVRLQTVQDGYDLNHHAYGTPWQTLTAWLNSLREGDIDGLSRCYTRNARATLMPEIENDGLTELKGLTVARSFQHGGGIAVVAHVEHANLAITELIQLKFVSGKFLISDMMGTMLPPRLHNIAIASSPAGPLTYVKPKDAQTDKAVVYKYGFGEDIVDGKPSSFMLTADIESCFLIVFAFVRDPESNRISTVKLGSFEDNCNYDFDERPNRIKLHFGTTDMPSHVESLGLVECNYMVNEYEQKISEQMTMLPLRIVDFKSLGSSISTVKSQQPSVTELPISGPRVELINVELLRIANSKVDISDDKGPNLVFEDTFSRTGLLKYTRADSGHTWNFATSRTSTNGSELVVNSGAKVAIEGVHLKRNSKYELSLDLIVDGDGHYGSDGWIAFGFGRANSNNPFTSSIGTMLHRRGGRVDLYPGQRGVSVDRHFPARCSIEIQTGQDLNTSLITFKRNGKIVDGPMPIDASAVSSIYVQSITGTTGKADNLKLTCVAVAD
ncbi:MAG: hypothetical protein KDB27_30115 [Planctomycetales bacterium]|nr:hypothetical protein [Planctomycetales bacterium]